MDSLVLPIGTYLFAHIFHSIDASISFRQPNSDITVKTGAKRKNRWERWLNSQMGAHLPPAEEGCVVTGTLSHLLFTDTALWGAQQQGSRLLHLQLLKQTEKKASHEFPWLHF